MPCGLNTGLPGLLPLLVLLAACRPEPFPPPDPDQLIPPASCQAEHPIALSSIAPDSALDAPPWHQLCTLCPADSIDFRLVNGEGAEQEIFQAWAEGGQCAVAMSQSPLSAAQDWSLQSTLSDGTRSAVWEVELTIAAGAGAPPLDLGTATWIAAAERGSLRLPIFPDQLEEGLLPPAPELLLSFSPQGKDGLRRMHLAGLSAGEQDLCIATTELEGVVLDTEGRFSGLIPGGARVPTPLGDRIERGLLQGQLSADGSQLLELALIAVLDVAAQAASEQVSVEEVCALWEQQLGSDPCVPCVAPDLPDSGPADCVTTVLEWREIPLADVPLQPLTIDQLSADCPPSL
ncbi:MAG: hypothetical protein CMP23_09140 [Rickettsiales bacterium]|nr:hypothetical protein [Rickettsiales bacterium]|tara:strand:- start:783 stop:1823 length:1041 start_codon:yes stop_codon:yes gene_type:complete